MSRDPRNSNHDSHLHQSLLGGYETLRIALIELYASVGADPGNPQEAARRFNVNKTLTWTISKVMGNSDPLIMLPSVPGESALNGFLRAMQDVGARKGAVERVRAAAAELHQMVELQVGDRSTLELIVDGMEPGRGDQLALSRKLAFRGNSGLWGVQARTRLHSVLLAPNRVAPDRIDMAVVRGYIGLRRLRSDVSWPIFQIRQWGAVGDAMAAPWRPLDESVSGQGGLPLLREFSTACASDFETKQTAQGADYLLAPGRIGNAGATDCFLGDFGIAAAGKYQTEDDTTGEFGATISAPTERLVFDLLADEQLDFVLKPEVRAFAGVFMHRSEESAPEGMLPIPVPQSVVPLPGRPPVVATPAVPRYPEIVGYVQDRMQWNIGQFRGCRFEFLHPPLGSTILLRFKLMAPP